MNKLIKYTYLTAILLGISLLLMACDKNDSDTEFGYAYIYMPQATFSKVANNSDYPVPSYSDGSTEQTGNAVANYVIEKSDNDERIKIVLGVTRSGLQSLEAYTVDIKTDNDTIIKAQAAGLYGNAVLVDTNVYTLPQSLLVAKGERDNHFYLELSKNRLLADTRYAGKSLILAVKIENASRYEINKELATTIVIVNGWENLE